MRVMAISVRVNKELRYQKKKKRQKVYCSQLGAGISSLFYMGSSPSVQILSQVWTESYQRTHQLCDFADIVLGFPEHIITSSRTTGSPLPTFLHLTCFFFTSLTSVFRTTVPKRNSIVLRKTQLQHLLWGDFG